MSKTDTSRPKYVSQSPHAIDLANGKVLEQGQASVQVDPENPHDAALIEEGHIVPRPLREGEEPDEAPEGDEEAATNDDEDKEDDK